MNANLKKGITAGFVVLAVAGTVAVALLLYNGLSRPASLIGREIPVFGGARGVTAPPLVVPRTLSGHDQDGDGIDDLDDIVHGARAEAERHPIYRDAYYKGGYPPATEGVCTDVVWRAFKEAGYNLKDMVDRDIAANISVYPRVAGKPDPNIDFRRVANLAPFFIRHAMSLPIEIKPGDIDNLKLWQGGDIVVFDKPYPHIGIISDKRRPDGVPFLIHNGGPVASETDYLLRWPSPIKYHFRFPKP